MLIILTGQDTYRSRERLKQLREAFVEKYDKSGMNVTPLEASGLKFETFESAVTSQGFLSTRRFVIVERPYELDAKVQGQIAAFIKNKGVPEEAIVVFWIGEESRKGAGRPRGAAKIEKIPSPLVPVFQKVKNREVFDLLEPQEVEQWIASFVKSQKGKIEPAAVSHLASAVGSDLWLAANELTKLLYQHGRSISLAQARASITAKEEESIFALTDALSRKDDRIALQLLEQQFDNGANELYLLTMLFRQIRILLSVGDVAASEPNPATIATRLKLHPFVVQKALQQVRVFSQSELIAIHRDLVEVDRKLKSTRTNPRALLELAVLRFCQR